MKAQYILILLFCLGLSAACTKGKDVKQSGLAKVTPNGFENTEVGGELRMRLLRNYDRLERDKYLPENVFLSEEESGSWPGDTEGRTILGLVLDARATGRAPKTLETIIRTIPAHLNEKGYMGVVYPEGKMDEQQISGNGWMLRGLCEYYEWTNDGQVLEMIRSIVNNLFLPGKGLYKLYPIDPTLRATGVGEASGKIYSETDGWRWSSDTGCMFIGMAGLIHAYQLIPSDEVREVIDEMIGRFWEMDLRSMRTQTHATLTGMRGILRYAELTDDPDLVKKMEEYWTIYKQYGMTEHHANYNWFERYDTWTEPCAIVDSYIIASKLWMLTLDPGYLADAELIYYNALSYAQRDNGGFACDECVGKNHTLIGVFEEEAHWCCTMRGGEGLSRAAEYSFFSGDKAVYLAHYVDSRATVRTGNSEMTLTVNTAYPMSGVVDIAVDKVSGKAPELRLNALAGFVDIDKVTINGQQAGITIDNGFIVLKNDWKAGDLISFSFEPKLRIEKPMNMINCDPSQNKVYYGVLLMGAYSDGNLKISSADQLDKTSLARFDVKDTGYSLTPLYHLMSPEVHRTGRKKQILF